ncbi:hypothetical protein C1752_02343 [Acaryochloris thomasi RCC1774]|uniref:Sulfotransferase domain-containing protein n=1 Tax=Acaryochloris thomasi RCC1774 TaxID=1764569 RepID=A0A2W1JX36_9CYAN|nr:sulfotransferase [Acaryochloris thomasi]PZD73231.1 hypothetical protein C1752_02343 [Acaryochloris thomasi RCC1774]
MKQYIPTGLKQHLRKTLRKVKPVIWTNLGPVSWRLARSSPLASPPVLILSLPRSGSSWVGEILGQSESSLYLHEPITQTYLDQNVEAGPSFFEIDANNLPIGYRFAADAAFLGLPIFHHVIVKSPSQWMWRQNRQHQRALIKEVNPFALQWCIDEYKPRIIYLVRHPVSVANSFSRMGWTGKQFESRLSPQTLSTLHPNYQNFTHSFWAEMGALQAVTLNRSLEILQKYDDFTVVEYEEICADPLTTFRQLYNFAGLQWQQAIEDRILSKSNASNQNRTQTYSTSRSSNAMINSWKGEVSEGVIAEVRDAYCAYNPPYYAAADDW